MVPLIALASSCGSSNQDSLESSYFPFKEGKSDKWGFINSDGEKLIEDEFNASPSPIVNEIFFVRSSNGYEMYSKSEPTKPIGDTYDQIAYFTSDFTPSVKKNEGIKYIDKKGEVKYELPLSYKSATRFCNGYSLITQGDVNGVLNEKFEIFQPKKYSIMDVFDSNKFLACKIDAQERRMYLINDKEEVLTEYKSFTGMFSPDKKYYLYSEDGLYGIRDNKHQKVISPKYKNIEFIGDDYLYVRNEDYQSGVINTKGDIVLKCRYSGPISYKDGYFLVREQGNGYGIVDKKGDRIIKCEFDYLAFIPGSKNLNARKKDDKREYVINMKGEDVFDAYEIKLPDRDEYYYSSSLLFITLGHPHHSYVKSNNIVGNDNEKSDYSEFE